MTTTASSRSSATVPSPSHSGRYADTNGTTVSTRSIGTYESATTVVMCRARKTRVSSATLRCSPHRTNRGRRAGATPPRTRIPPRRVSVRSTSATRPVPRLTYQIQLPVTSRSSRCRSRTIPEPEPVDPEPAVAVGVVTGACRESSRGGSSRTRSRRRRGRRRRACWASWSSRTRTRRTRWPDLGLLGRRHSRAGPDEADDRDGRGRGAQQPQLPVALAGPVLTSLSGHADHSCGRA